MLSFDEHSGIISFLGGIIVLVMASIGLSLMTDLRLKSSSSVVKIENEISQDRLQLEALRSLYAERSGLLNDAGIPWVMQAIEAKLGDLKTLRDRKASLDREMKQLRSSIVDMEDEFFRCRSEFRRKVWTSAPGEKLGNLILSNGREYRDATITRVTDVGLEIRHADGIARIQAPDLDQKIQDRFQWDDEERRKVLKDELEHLDSIATKPVEKAPEIIAGIPERPAREPLRSQSRITPDSAEVTTLRRIVIGWKSKVSQLRFERSVALSNFGYGSQTSVPGSLETWGAKAERLGNELIRAQSELAVAKFNLAAVAPGDPLLRPEVVNP